MTCLLPSLIGFSLISQLRHQFFPPAERKQFQIEIRNTPNASIQQTEALVRQMHQYLGSALPIIGVGGISSGQDALDKLSAGASLVQVYTGFIYRGSELITDILETVYQSPSICDV